MITYPKGIRILRYIFKLLRFYKIRVSRESRLGWEVQIGAESDRLVSVEKAVGVSSVLQVLQAGLTACQ
jgi:hypothetical protein